MAHPALSPAPGRRGYDRAKRLFDLAGAALLLLLSAPAMAVIALALVLEDGRPVLFRQARTGRDGRPFAILKFRTLRLGNHDPDDPLAVATRTGRWLRQWGLDEWPQLWNIVRGEMSLVGPRPALPSQTARYGPFEQRRLTVPPGLTGWAQINGRNAIDWPERIRLDVWYVDHRSFGLDLRILLRTLPVLLRGEGVYGAEGRNPDFEPAAKRQDPR